MNAKIAFLSLLVIAVLLEVLADVFLKEWSRSSRTLLLATGLAIYALGTLFWAFSLRYEYLSRAITVFTVLNLVAVLLVGTLYFGERLTGMQQAGVALGVASVVLMEL